MSDTLADELAAAMACAAGEIGSLFTQYRPAGITNPLGSPIATTQAAIVTAQQRAYGRPLWNGLFSEPFAAGDYFVRQSDGATWFVAACDQPTQLPLCVRCDRVVTLSRPAPERSGEYGGGSPGTATSYLPEWPAGFMLTSTGQTPGTNLPGDVRSGGAQVYLPPSVPVQIKPDDFLTEDLGNKWIVSSFERTDLGWRLMVFYSGA